MDAEMREKKVRKTFGGDSGYKKKKKRVDMEVYLC